MRRSGYSRREAALPSHVLDPPEWISLDAYRDRGNAGLPSMSESRWKFQVEGSFCRDRRPLIRCEAIIESGDRDEDSPHRLLGVGPVARADANGRFRSWYLTHGSSEAVASPLIVSVYVRVARGTREPIRISVDPESAEPVSHREMRVNLGLVMIPDGMTPYAPKGGLGESADPDR
jgi:hypothetical protein